MLRGVQIRALLTESWVELAAPCSGVDVIHYRRSDPTACPAGCLSGPSASRARSVQGPAGPVADRFALDSPEPRGNPLRFHWSAHRSVTISLSVYRRCSYPRFCQESPDSLLPALLSVKVLLRWVVSSESLPSFPPTGPYSGAALCSAGSLGLVPRLPRSYCGTPTSARPLVARLLAPLPGSGFHRQLADLPGS